MAPPKLPPEEKAKRIAESKQRVKDKYANNPEIRKRKQEHYLANKAKLNAYNNARYHARKKELQELRELKHEIESQKTPEL